LRRPSSECHVELFVLTGAERLLLFDVAANREGTIRAVFEVPPIAAGSYRLEACSRGPELPGVATEPTCLPEGNFTVLAGQARSGEGFPVSLSVVIGFAIAFAAALASALLYRRRRNSRSPR
jgi:hypothetical protein